MTLQRAAPVVVLASASAARAGVLAAAGIAFTVAPAAVDETAIKTAAQAEGCTPGDAALLLATTKAARIAARHSEALVIGADQILVCEGAWFDKPPDLAAARAQLLALRGRTHTLATAIVCHAGGGEVWHHLATPRLRMRDFSELFLDAYLAVEGPAILASVGGYRIEGPGAQLFAAVEGEHTAILGLPLLPLLGFLRDHGVLLG